MGFERVASSLERLAGTLGAVESAATAATVASERAVSALGEAAARADKDAERIVAAASRARLGSTEQLDALIEAFRNGEDAPASLRALAETEIQGARDALAEATSDVEAFGGAITTSGALVNGYIEQLAGAREPVLGLRKLFEATTEDLAGGQILVTSYSKVIGAVLADVRAGIQDTHQAATALADFITLADGTVRTFAGYILSVSKTMGQIQGEVREFVKNIRGSENEIQQILSALIETQTAVGINLAALIEAVKLGHASVDDLVRAVAGLKRQGLSGSTPAILAEAALEAFLAEATRGGGL